MEAINHYKPAQLSAQSQAVLNNKNIKTPATDERAMKAAKEFEAVFLTNMLENMFTGIEAEEPFGGGHAEKVFRSMQVAEYANAISKNGGIGMTQHVYQELLAAQEGVKR